jgi:hypothetical protein
MLDLSSVNAKLGRSRQHRRAPESPLSPSRQGRIARHQGVAVNRPLGANFSLPTGIEASY